MPVRIAHHRKVTHHAAHIHRWLNQNILLPRVLGNAIDFLPAIALEAEMIQKGFHFILNYDQDEDRIFSRRSGRPEPDVVPPLEPAIAHDRKTAERSVKVD